ncbi:hypothetical protein STENM223S_06793 [Streptomyces tendae]
MKVLVADPEILCRFASWTESASWIRVGSGRTQYPGSRSSSATVLYGSGSTGMWYCDSVEKVGDETSADTFEYDMA